MGNGTANGGGVIALQSYLRGEWVRGSGRTSTLVNPATAEPVAETSTDGLDLGAALAYGREVGGPALRALTFAERGTILRALSSAIHEARDALLEASTLNAGTTRSDGKFDIDGASATLAHYAALGQALGDRRLLVEEGEAIGRGARFYGTHVWTPRVGIAVHINAFNFPAWGLAEKAACALLAGVPVLAKPATSTALLAYRCMETIVAAEVLPAGALQLLCGSAGDLLDHLEEQDVLAFTGSGDTGATLRRGDGVAARSVRVNVEADSLNATVLAPSVDAEGDVYARFLRDAVLEITQKTGQKCTATRRIFVPEGLIDRVQRDLAERLADVKVGDPANPEVRMGPLATAAQLRDFRDGVARLEAAGARRVLGSPTEVSLVGADGRGFFVGPVLLRADGPDDAAAVHEHEVFGPCATLLPYRSLEDAIRGVAKGGGGLVASVYGDDRKELAALALGLAPHHGRVLIGSRTVAEQATAPGLVLPSCVHGGPGRAGGGEELGGERGLRFYMQRTAFQGDRALLDRIFG
ncbi:MAG: 3,4-dehydroadipyl-CoA semialdehyde dehydrogenase [Sandaracinaceae bacterium]